MSQSKGFTGYKAYKGYKEPTREDLELLYSKLKDLVSEAKRVLQYKKGIHGYYITPFISDEIELAFNYLCEAEELFDKDFKASYDSSQNTLLIYEDH